MSNNITDLNAILFNQLRRLDDPTLAADKLADEVERTKAITVVARELLTSGQLQLQAEKARGELIGLNPMPGFLNEQKRLK